MRPVSQWGEEDLWVLVQDKVCEGREWDFKDSRIFSKDAFKGELAKDVAAFANAAGGTIVIGVTEVDMVATGVDDGVPLGTKTAERLADIIQGNIEPKVEGLQTASLVLSNGNLAFVITCPAATAYAPHQASDKRYYRRVDARNQQMADHEVRDLMRRKSTPRPAIVFEVYDERAPERKGLKRLYVSVVNESPEPMHHAFFCVHIDARILPDVEYYIAGWSVEKGPGTVFDRNLNIITLCHMHGPPGSMPVWKECAQRLFSIVVDISALDDTFVLGWRVSSPGVISKFIGEYRTDEWGLRLQRHSYD